MSDAWEEIQAVKSKRNSLREKLEKRKKERQNILSASLGSADKPEGSPSKDRAVSSPVAKNDRKYIKHTYLNLYYDLIQYHILVKYYMFIF